MDQLMVGDWNRSMQDVLPLTDRLRAELHSMKEEHKAIVAALHTLISVARSEQKLEAARFAERLIMHAHMEEQILYPAALLVGELVRARLNAELSAHELA
jgi:hemerythrin superfamily protein